MSRLQQLYETRDKINTEIAMIQGADCNPTSNQAQACREKTPEEIIEDLFTYHRPDEMQEQSYTTIRDAAKHLALVLWKNCPFGADRTAAIRKLREAVMTANAAIALRGVNL